MGNGLVAILAGLLGHVLVESLSLGPVAPFDAAALVLLAGGAVVVFTWPENYGDSTHTTPALESFRQAAAHIANGELTGPEAVWSHSWAAAVCTAVGELVCGSLCSLGHPCRILHIFLSS